eukprot:gene9113-10686_t
MAHTSQSALELKCNGCREVYYCDTMCMLSNRDIHDRYECAYFKKLRTSYLGPTVDKFDSDTFTEIRMLLGILGRHIHAALSEASGSSAEASSERNAISGRKQTINIDGKDYPLTENTIDDVFSLVENQITEENNDQAKQRVDTIVEFISRLLQDVLLPQDKKKRASNQGNDTGQEMDETMMMMVEKKKQVYQDVVGKIRSLCCKIRCNQFGIWSKKDKCVGVSVTPSASFFNHSCVPNCADIRGTTIMEFKALHAIAKGTPLSITYLDLDQPTQTRQEYLKYSYFFDCRCKRCVDSSGALDDWISQFYCSKPKCSGTLVLADRTTDIDLAKDSVTLTCSYCNIKKQASQSTLVPPCQLFK